MDNPTKELRFEIIKRLIDLGVYRKRSNQTVEKLAAVLQQRLGKKISGQTLTMALSGVRTTSAYRGYLEELRAHLDECHEKASDPFVIIATNRPESQ